MDAPREPPAPKPAVVVAYGLGLPLALAGLVFVPAGNWHWLPGWVFVATLVGGFSLSVLVLLFTNPAIFRARSRFQPGTERWDFALLSLMLPLMVAILPLGAYAATHWEVPLPLPILVLGHVLILFGIAVTTWAQSVNVHFEPGVRIQKERAHRVVSRGPYRYVRHPGYVGAFAMFAGMALALGSRWTLVPAVLAGAVLVLRTAWEDALLRRELPGYADYASRVRWRLLPGVW